MLFLKALASSYQTSSSLLLCRPRAFISSSSPSFCSFLSRIDKAGLLPCPLSVASFLLSENPERRYRPRRRQSRRQSRRGERPLASVSFVLPLFFSRFLLLLLLLLFFLFPPLFSSCSSSLTLLLRSRIRLVILYLFLFCLLRYWISFPFAASSCVYVHSLPNRHIPVFT